jgi:hypothetical protein
MKMSNQQPDAFNYEPIGNYCSKKTYIQENIDYMSVPKNEVLNQEPIFVGNKYDDNNLANVGWGITHDDNLGYRLYFSKQNINFISAQIRAQLLKAGFNMIVTDEVITNVMSEILRKHTPFTGDIYTRYIIPTKSPRNDLDNMNNRVINIIVSNIIDEEDARKWNESLSVWDTVLGSFNRKGLNQFTTIRKKDNDYMKGQINFNY